MNVLKSLVTLATHRGHGFDAHFMLFEALKQRTFYEVQPNVIALVLAERDKYTSVRLFSQFILNIFNEKKIKF